MVVVLRTPLLLLFLIGRIPSILSVMDPTTPIVPSLFSLELLFPGLGSSWAQSLEGPTPLPRLTPLRPILFQKALFKSSSWRRLAVCLLVPIVVGGLLFASNLSLLNKRSAALLLAIV
jgi:hypothetical protein